jgi:hypothetical protein
VTGEARAGTSTPGQTGTGAAATPPPSPSLGIPAPGDLAAQATDLIRAITLGTVATPADRVARAQQVAQVAAQLLRMPGMTGRGPRGRRITLDGWVAVGNLAGFLYGHPVGPHIVQVDALAVEGGTVGFTARAEARTAAGQLLATGAGQAVAPARAQLPHGREALRSMAQNLAVCQAMRQALGWIVALSGGEFDLAAAEEVTADLQQSDEAAVDLALDPGPPPAPGKGQPEGDGWPA